MTNDAPKVLDGYESQTVKEGDIRYDNQRNGIWVGDDIFLPHNVVVWAFQALIPADQEGDQ